MITTLLAQATPPNNICGIFPGCSDLQTPANVVAESAIPAIATLMLNTIAGLCLVFVVIGGARYILSFGREEEQTRATKMILWSLAAMVLALLSHRIVVAVSTTVFVSGATVTTSAANNPIINVMMNAVRVIILLLNVTFLLMIILGGMRIVVARGKEEEVTKGRKTLMYAVVGAIVINVAPFLVSSAINILQ